MLDWGEKKRRCAKAGGQSNLCPIAKDSTDGPQLVFHLALIYAWTGERDLAIEQLEIVAKIPTGPTYGSCVWIRCGTRCAAIRASKKSSPPSRQDKTSPRIYTE